MDIKIITIHAMHNPGSVFQAYALQKYLSKQHNAQIIDYRPGYFYSEGSKIKLWTKKILFSGSYGSRNKKFNQFIQENLVLTSLYTDYNQLENGNLHADVFMAGSDQLWNTDFPCGHDKAFYLEFVKQGKKVSYSTSVGKENIDFSNLSVLKGKLPYFDALAVREKSNAEFLTKELGRSVKWVCDPVFLLEAEEYMPFISSESPIEDPYVVIYLSGANRILDEIVNYYHQRGLKVVLAGGFTRRCKCDIHIKDVGPEDFLNLIYHSQAVISSSFHATAFSHIFHKEFITLVPKANGERIYSLLRKSGLIYRGVDSTLNWNLLEKETDWNKVQNNLEEYIRESKEYLSKVLE
ncbi:MULTISPECIES: polysaccharide pyruvyl transferase family protein [Megasphaera]|uniref:Polysaccharide pyruvyl transferase n=1 Tax=Megasphaera vaginalis (ex Srinivasan et al. 2021) TaxID=1111454 RepID=U7US59_9FIRM|nr:MULTISPECIES: polysaccharide pyruvyl transferase family protein [Megasphaera]ERT62287.1 polysaccharide pyruvyl transferase [Megasphaera vaginalis (ex Srinivasan et al. 2021)]